MNANDPDFQRMGENICRHLILNEEEVLEVSRFFYPRRLRKKEHWLMQGDHCSEVIYITKGCLRLYHSSEHTDRSLEFFFEDSWYTDFESILTKRPAINGVEALEDTEVLAIAFRDLVALYDKFPKLERIGRLIAESTVVHLCNLYNSLLVNTPQERYIKLLQEKSKIIDRVPQHLIASYIGVEPETLSRIRKKIMADQIA